MNDGEIDDLLKGARVPSGPEPEVLERIRASVSSELRPVRPMPPRWVLTAALCFVAAAIAVAGASRAGFSGIASMLPWERALIFALLGIFCILAAGEFVNSMMPASRRRVSSGTLLTVGTAALLGAFAVCFHDYHATNFFGAGLACLETGVMYAIPTALLSWVLLRRGVALNPVSAGFAAGTLAGIAGLGVLELQCNNFQAAHVLVWHTAVLLTSAAGGAISGWLLLRARR